MIVKLLTEHHLEFLSLKGGSIGSSQSILVKISNCWKSHVAAHISFFVYTVSLMVHLIGSQLKGVDNQYFLPKSIWYTPPISTMKPITRAGRCKDK